MPGGYEYYQQSWNFSPSSQSANTGESSSGYAAIEQRHNHPFYYDSYQQGESSSGYVAIDQRQSFTDAFCKNKYETTGIYDIQQARDDITVSNSNIGKVSNRNRNQEDIQILIDNLEKKIQKASNSDEIVNACNKLQDNNVGEVVSKLNVKQQQAVVGAYVNQLEDVKETLGLDKADSVSVITADGLVSASSLVDSSNIPNAQAFLVNNGIINLDEYGVNNWKKFVEKVQNNAIFADEVIGVISSWIKSKFEYVADHEEEWNSFNSMVDMFNDNKIVEGDCEDVANFALNLFYGAGFNNSQVQAYGIAGNAENPGHIVLGYSSGTEAKRIIDFTQEFGGMDGLELLNSEEYDFSYNSNGTSVMRAGSQYVFASSESDYGIYIAETLGKSIYSIIDIIIALGTNKVKDNYDIEGSFFEKITNRVEESLFENNGKLGNEAKNSLAIKILTEYCAESAWSIGGALGAIGNAVGSAVGAIGNAIGNAASNAAANPGATAIGIGLGLGLSAIGLGVIGTSMAVASAITGQSSPVDMVATNLANTISSALGLGVDSASASSAASSPALGPEGLGNGTGGPSAPSVGSGPALGPEGLGNGMGGPSAGSGSSSGGNVGPGLGVDGAPSDGPGSMGGAPGGGAKVLCTELNRQGLLSDELLSADLEYAKQIHPFVVAGYHAWAKPLVKVMQKSSIVSCMLKPFITAWAKHMAYKMQCERNDNILGCLLEEIGIPICYLIGYYRTGQLIKKAEL